MMPKWVSGHTQYFLLVAAPTMRLSSARSCPAQAALRIGDLLVKDHDPGTWIPASPAGDLAASGLPENGQGRRPGTITEPTAPGHPMKDPGKGMVDFVLADNDMAWGRL
jgi:hypothetical protein